MDLVEAEYLAGVEEARRRYPDAMLSILWLGSSGEAAGCRVGVQRQVKAAHVQMHCSLHSVVAPVEHVSKVAGC